jgi:Tfp pilus assembly protein PilX
MFKNSEKGVSLIITFFIMIIVLAVLLSISIILYSEVRIVRNIGDSVVAFYVADSGVEKTLYYDRKIVPEDAKDSKRGVCGMCNKKTPTCPDCDCVSEVSNTGDPKIDGCDPKSCENCTITFKSTLSSNKEYSVTTVVTPYKKDGSTDKFSQLSIDSTGSYTHAFGVDAVKRAIRLDALKDESQDAAPVIKNYLVDPVNVPAGSNVKITLDIYTKGHGVESATAEISGYNYLGDRVLEPITKDFTPQNGVPSDGIYTLTWTPTLSLAYVVVVKVCDAVNGACVEETIINQTDLSQ